VADAHPDPQVTASQAHHVGVVLVQEYDGDQTEAVPHCLSGSRAEPHRAGKKPDYGDEVVDSVRQH
jgi:hypothetical protein